ncbi:DUF58 domain-containing protein [Leucobacter triazinivorans]|uniref:DUF58 domain-containing protein n=1 Tax=Leucobacter triazinivorans TaxID=1784719 RepID=A0A4P6KDB8_9MICO|nr:DUF58 domain-containing protein [Leucobacter triazinivorans]QBE47868.1 DUF58 domain-containing protein [Leucobacter triazinivorans]
MNGSPRLLRAMPLTLTARGAALLVLAAAAGGLWAAVRLRDVLALAALAVAAVAVSIVWLLLIRIRLRPRAELTTDVRTPSAGDVVTATAVVQHDLACSHSAELVWEMPGDVGARPIVLRRRAEARQSVRWTAERRGAFALSAAALVISDPLGIARMRIHLGASAEVLVLPTPLPPELMPGGLGARDGAHRTPPRQAVRPTPGSSRSVTAEEAGEALREYRPGDPPRRVHWKQSARQDRLLVNLPEHGTGERFAVALIVDSDAYRAARDGTPPEDFEQAVSLAAALVTRLGGSVVARRTAPRRSALDLRTVRGAGGTPLVDRAAVGAAEALRALARAQPVRVLARAQPVSGPSDARPAGLDFRPTAIITGSVTPEVVALASRSPAGTVVITSPEVRGSTPGSALPRGWELVRAPGTRASAAGAVAGSAAAGSVAAGSAAAAGTGRPG